MIVLFPDPFQCKTIEDTYMECIVQILLHVYFKSAHLDSAVCPSLLSELDSVARINYCFWNQSQTDFTTSCINTRALSIFLYENQAIIRNTFQSTPLPNSLFLNFLRFFHFVVTQILSVRLFIGL